MKTAMIFGAIVLLVAFLVWVNWEKFVPAKINPNWKAEYDAAVNAGYALDVAAGLADKAFPKYLTA